MGNQAEDMAGEQESTASGHPALKGFNRTWEYTKYVAKESMVMALKGAVIIGLVAAVMSLPFSAPAGGLAGIVNWALGTKFAWGSASMASMAFQGAVVGAMGGAAIGLARGVGGAEDAVEDKEQSIISKHNRAKRLAANQQVLEQGMANSMRWQAQHGHTAHGAVSPGFSPGMGQGRNDGVTIA